ncbi:MAG: TonB-dependent receptor domain-containing protein [Acidobacteriota bacterium]
MSRRPAVGLVMIVVLGLGSPAEATRRAETFVPIGETPQATTGRVIATITTLEGTVRMPGVDVELRAPDGIVLARTVTDGAGQVVFPDCPPGRFTLTAARPGFVPRDSAPFDVRPGEVTEVLLDIQLTFVMPAVEVRAPSASPTNSVQPVSMSDMLAGSVMELAPLEGDDFQSLLPLLPGVLRGSDGRLRIKGGQPTQGALQVSAASLIDPSSGDFDLQLPGQSIDSVEVLANPFAAEYGRFSTSVTQIRTRRGTNDWEWSPGNFVPRFRKWFSGIRNFEPRLSLRGPLQRDRVFFSQDVQFRYVGTPVRSLPGEPEIELTSFDAFTRVDAVVSSSHTLGGGLVAFPRQVARATMSTFRPPEVAPDFTQGGFSVGAVDRLALASSVVLETTVSLRRFEVEITAGGTAPMIFAPETQGGRFFNDQERHVASLQWVEALNVTRSFWGGQHVLKFGTDLQRSWYDGNSVSRPIEVRRADGSLAERTVFGPRSFQEVTGLETALFAQDRWRIGSRITLELGIRLDRDAIVENVDWSPRAGIAVGVLPEGRGILRGGYGRFVQRTPLNIEAFPSFEPRVVSRFEPNGSPRGASVAFRHVVDKNLHTPAANVGNVEWDQRFSRRVLLKVAFLGRQGGDEYILTPDASRGELRLSSGGMSRYKELEATVRYLGGGRRDLTTSYVWARGVADLNNYDQFYGNFRHPLVRVNERTLIPTDVRHRLIVRGNIGFPGAWDFAPVLELRSGFPWSAVDEFQDFVGPRNRTGRLPAVRTLDFSLTRPWRVRKYEFRAGVKMYNVFGSSAARDVQNHLASPSYGRFFNPIERSIGITFGASR